MNIKPELKEYLESEKNKLNTEFPKCEEITTEMFQQVYDFFDVNLDDLSDNRVYRLFLVSYKEIICFAFERDASKVYMRHFFKIMNNEILLEYLTSKAKSRAKDIRNIMDRFVHFFITSWQNYGNNKEPVLQEIITLIDYWM